MIAHQVASGLSAHGGPSYTVPALCRSLSECGVTIVLHDLGPSEVDTGGLYQFISHRRSKFMRRLGLSASMRRALSNALGDADIIHSHLLWMMPNIYPGLLMKVKASRCHLVMSPRGTLDPWEYHSHKLQKRIAWIAGQRLNLASSSCLHATAPMECAHFRALGLKAPIAIIPNGVEIPDLTGYPRISTNRRKLLFLARINPKKGVDILLRAWRNVQNAAPEWELQIAGSPNRTYLPEMRQLAADLGVQRVSFLCPVNDEQKWSLYRQADLYVLPTRGDNWAVSISDALSFGVPAIVSKHAPWEGLHTYDCGWWIDLSVDSLTACFESALKKESTSLHAMGQRGRDWMKREFSWHMVGCKMRDTYKWLVAGGETPEWVVK